MVKIIGIIPARYASSRFPGKPLADIGGKSMIQRVYEQSSLALEKVLVATDDRRIYSEVEAFGGAVVMTSPEHASGTDRCAEALQTTEEREKQQFAVVVNIQGDEPFIDPAQIQALAVLFNNPSTGIGSLMKKVVSREELENPDLPKVVCNRRGEALYFSRHPIPYQRGRKISHWLKYHTYYRHIGLYGYRREALLEISKLSPTPLEKSESLEQNRWLEHGFRITMGITEKESQGVDRPEDLERIVKKMKL